MNYDKIQVKERQRIVNDLFKDIDLDHFMDKNKTYVIGVSTGIDSMSLFNFLREAGYHLVVAHVNHKRREASEKEYSFLKDYCDKLNVPFEGYELTKKIEGNFQEEARKERYDFFKRVADKYHTTNIVVAHQADDEAETIVMRLIRGTSMKGYQGIPLKSVDDGYTIYRPLLYTSRVDIETYQKSHNVTYFEDQTNAENHYTRNIVRHNIIPVMKKINPNFLEATKNYQEDLKNAYELIEKLSIEFMNKYVSFSGGIVIVKERPLNKEPEALKNEIILRAINLSSNNTVLATHERIREIAKLSDSLETGKTIELQDDFMVVSSYGELIFKKKDELLSLSFTFNDFGDYEIPGYGHFIISQKYHLLPDKKSYMLCYNEKQLVFPITIRTHKSGDEITVNSITKKVSDLLIDLKVPRYLRSRVLVVQNASGIFFIPGLMRKETDKSLKNVMYITLTEEK